MVNYSCTVYHTSGGLFSIHHSLSKTVHSPRRPSPRQPHRRHCWQQPLPVAWNCARCAEVVGQRPAAGAEWRSREVRCGAAHAMADAASKAQTGTDGIIEIPPSEDNVARYTGHVNSINCMFVIDDAKEAGESMKTTYIFTGGYDHTARCFNAETGECLFVYRGHKSFIFALKINIEPKMSEKHEGVVESTLWFLYTGSYDGTVKRWDVSTGECVKTYELEYGDENPRFRAGVITHLEVYEALFFTVTADKCLRAWRITDGEMVWDGRGHTDAITGLQMRAKFERSDEFRMYESPAELFTCSSDKTVCVGPGFAAQFLLQDDDVHAVSAHVTGVDVDAWCLRVGVWVCERVRVLVPMCTPFHTHSYTHS